jgi:(R,R)-butanediol dehydrogenase/meso-butanediol dehydrogenase/diacetyl reductase
VKAAVFHGPRDVRVEDVREPAGPAPDDVLLEVVRAAICGTDASEWDHGPVLCRPDVVLGHGFVGRVVGRGGNVTSLRVGDRVVSIVAGASHCAAGGRVVAVDIDEGRLDTALTLGATETANAAGRDLAELLLELSDGVGFDIVVEASGASHAPAAAIAGARRGGRVLLVGLHGAPRALELTPMIVREVDVVTTVAHVCDTDIPAALELLTESDVATVTAGSRIPLDDLVEEGLRPLAERRASGKVLVTP